MTALMSKKALDRNTNHNAVVFFLAVKKCYPGVLRFNPFLVQKQRKGGGSTHSSEGAQHRDGGSVNY